MGDNTHTTDKLDQERRDEALSRNIDPGSDGRGGPLDMGGGIQTGANEAGTPHRSQLDVDTGAPLTGAMDDLPDMTGAEGSSALNNAAAGGGSGMGGVTASGADTESAPAAGMDVADEADNANMGRGSDRFDASDAYTGVDSADALTDKG